MHPVKKFINNIFFTGALGAALFFALSFLMTPQWLVSARIVVFPAGLPTVQKNLAQEVGNTAEILRSARFQEENLQNFRNNLLDIRQIENSSTIAVDFLAAKDDVTAIEDIAVLIPNEISEYSRDLYGGTPFKYELLSDPEVSAKNVRPDLTKNSLWGFLAGIIIYLLFWNFFDSTRKKPMETEEIFQEEKFIMPDLRPMVSPNMDMERKTEKIPAKEIFSAPERKEEPTAIITPRDMQNIAPSNLPIAEDTWEKDKSPADETGEPSDEEVKDRLNKLMRGEL
ncbi:MAG: hypothetical protein UX02_C0002G0222 [Candidatus Moranbacteria bacterium GW2011_GWC1_45_18]|nr:MAG: hypothetical protein UT79_C0001G0239 [Candidatus Moranbacteria bacterium GW2011_GWC2_40_12]KKT33398.1 MAG: hypothetical protein UW19_C0009G0044 [Candidatus Moranbacteria bacterium GW2011_GWF2_44_10]KKT72061.1 MAG: hypothetical protein UW66_C0015G0002 [Candidatus Moranbacteria bacterium GW2011_GWF1_44_4]KKT99903.1 MAG: hypothetical protein UX02_C0002G0222 [Candidatus Moranbacteria bacterium GW2011_GWC1_45_18]OGI24021.1 MAG: hypothetical protein A2194_03515 [Candidatus Moranbacteria bacte